MVVQLK